ncbi:MAG: AAA family ATPase [Chloroflexaceae bacterium]|nr:AAA family ATPase [Chloroflexaceae bacterium]
MKLSLTRIFLYNWHRFHDHTIHVQDSLYLAGHNGSGKSSILDALQLVLVADRQRIRFNSSTQARSDRTLDSYVRGKVGEGRFLRPGNTIAYIALEFTDSQAVSAVTLGVCIEVGEGKSAERTFFIVTDAFDRDLLIQNGQALTRRELKQTLRSRRAAQTYDQVEEYQTNMLNRLGGLSPRFLDLFLKALTFQPIRNIREFVEQWLLEARPLDVETLRNVVDRLGELNITANQVETKIAALQAILERQTAVHDLRRQQQEYLILVALLQVKAIEQQIADLTTQTQQVQQQVEQRSAERTMANTALAHAQQSLLDAEVQLLQFDAVQRREELQRELQRATREVEAIRQRRQLALRTLHEEMPTLSWLLADDAEQNLALSETDRHCLQHLLDHMNQWHEGAPEPDAATLAALPDQIDAAVQVLEALLEQVQTTEYDLRQQVTTLRERGNSLEQELRHLQQGRLGYPRGVERLRELIAEHTDDEPALLCELIEVPDDRWQNAVEAMLGSRRFNVIVQPQYFDAAMRVLDQARAREKLYDVGLLDIARAMKEARRAQSGSLAVQVHTTFAALRSYIDTVLGDIITCHSLDELHHHRRAITPEVMLYSEWTVRAIPPGRYQPWFIGQRAQHSQASGHREALQEIGTELSLITPRLQAIEKVTGLLKRSRQLNRVRQQLELLPDDRLLREEIAEYGLQLKAIDGHETAHLEHEIARLRQIVAQEQAIIEQIDRAQGQREHEVQSLQQKLTTARRLQQDHEQTVADLYAQYPPRCGRRRNDAGPRRRTP